MVPPILSRVSLKYLWCSQHVENPEQKKKKRYRNFDAKGLMNLKAQEETRKVVPACFI